MRTLTNSLLILLLLTGTVYAEDCKMQGWNGDSSNLYSICHDEKRSANALERIAEALESKNSKPPEKKSSKEEPQRVWTM